MIVRPRLHWFRMLLVMQGSVLPTIWLQLLLIGALAALVTVANGRFLGWPVGLTFVPFTLIGIALAIFLGFRNSASYERYWEARKLLGAMLADTRNLARQHLTLVRADPAAQRRFVLTLVAFVHAVRHQLRGIDGRAELAPLIPAELKARLDTAASPPMLLLLDLGQQLGRDLAGQRLAPELGASLDRSLNELTAALSGCERIANTPIPYAYSVILNRTVYFYCALLPFGLIGSIGAITPLIVVFIAYTFLSLDALNTELEDPFGLMPNDLPLDYLAAGIEISLRELLGERDLPALPRPRDYVLT